MEIIKNFLLLIIFTFIEFNSLANPPFEIYYGKKGSWYVYLDVRKEIMVVEVAGIEYGFLDVLINKGQNDTVASSDVGVLLVENDTYYLLYQ